MDIYWFEIVLPGRKTYTSEKFRTYSSFVIACEKKCRELHAYSDDVVIYTQDSDTGNVFFGKPELGEIMP